jgi:hypothetical protein
MAPETSDHLPMTNPDAALAIHETSYGHSVSWVLLEDGRILMLHSGGSFCTSEDKGLTWSESFRGRDASGGEISEARGLVTLEAGSVGLVADHTPPDSINYYDKQLAFRRSDDGGHTWSHEVIVNPRGPGAFVWQDMLLRTSSGRIIIPAYLDIGQGRWHMDGEGFVGGFVNGNFVSTDAHFMDPHFGASYVWFSDDEGETWQRNSDGELFIVRKPGGPFDATFEPSVAEVEPGRLYMIMRTNLGRYFQAWSRDDGESWTRPAPTHLAGTHAPAQVRTLPNGHLLCVFTQQSQEEIRRGYIRTRLSSAVSRTGGRIWELFQNVESIHPEPYVPPGPIDNIRPEGVFSISEGGEIETDGRYLVPLPVGYGRWSYPSVLVLGDRVLISHSYTYHDETGARRGIDGKSNARIKVLPLSWFYGGREPYENPDLTALGQAARP